MSPRKQRSNKDDFVSRCASQHEENLHALTEQQNKPVVSLKYEARFQKEMKQILADALKDNPDHQDELNDDKSIFSVRTAIDDALCAARTVIKVYEDLEAIAAAPPEAPKAMCQVDEQEGLMESMLKTAYDVAHVKIAAHLGSAVADGAVEDALQREQVLHREYFKELRAVPAQPVNGVSVAGAVRDLEKGIERMTANLPGVEEL